MVQKDKRWGSPISFFFRKKNVSRDAFSLGILSTDIYFLEKLANIFLWLCGGWLVGTRAPEEKKR